MQNKRKRIGIQNYAQTSEIFVCPEIATKGGDHNIHLGMPHLRGFNPTHKNKKNRNSKTCCTVRKTQHQNPEFGPKPAEIRKNQENKCT